jgi:hypothetical protein
MCRSVVSLGEQEFVYGQLERFVGDDEDWVIPCGDYATYKGVEAYVECMFCSLDGSWVIISSSEGHSVAASSHEAFVHDLSIQLDVQPLNDALELVDHWKNDIYGSLDDWSGLRAGPPDWIEHLLGSVLAPDISKAAIARYREPPDDSRRP